MRTCTWSMQMKPSVEVSREAAVVPAVNVCTRRKHPLQPHATVASLGRSAPLLFITPSCTLALSVSLFCSLSLLLLFSFHVFFFFLPCISGSFVLVQYQLYVFSTKNGASWLFSWANGAHARPEIWKTPTKTDPRFHWLELSYIMTSLFMYALWVFVYNIGEHTLTSKMLRSKFIMN